MMKKKLISILALALSIAIVLTGCSKGKEEASNQDESSGTSSSKLEENSDKQDIEPLDPIELKDGNIYKEIEGLRFQYSEDYITMEDGGFQYIYINEEGSFIMAYAIDNTMDLTKSFAKLYFNEELKGFSSDSAGWKNGRLDDEVEGFTVAGLQGYKTSFYTESTADDTKFKIAVRTVSYEKKMISFFLLCEESAYEEDLVVFEEFMATVEITPA